MLNGDSSIETKLLHSRYGLYLLGGFELQALPGGDKIILPGKRERALLAYLALSPKGRQPRRKLAALLWGDATDETLLDNLRTCVWRLRKALGQGAHSLLASDDEDIVLDLASFDIDVLSLRRLAGTAGRGELESAARLLAGGLLLDGLELDSEEFESWRRLEASRHLDQAVELLSRLMRIYADGAEAERAIEMGGKILGLDPLHEATARQMMKLYAASGRRGAALQLYKNLAEALRRDVNAQPEAATRQLFATIAHAEEDLAVLRETAVETSVETGIENNPLPNPASVAPKSNPQPRPGLGWRLSLAALAAVFLVAAALDYWWNAPAPPTASFRSAAHLMAPAGTRIAKPVAGMAAPVTVAVLPFDNLSGNPGLQSFADGIGEEISAALGKMPALQLVARDAALQISREAATRDLQVTTGVRYLVEGGVRLAQNRVQVRVQLIQTDSGALLWSQNYERDLTDISTVRTDIALAIAQALKTPLGLNRGTDPVPANGVDADSYGQFLRARDMARARYTGVPEAIKILEPLVSRHPNYAPAWALLAQCYSEIPSFFSPYDIVERRRRIQIFFPMAEAAAHRAIGLDPKLPDPYLALIRLDAFRGKLAAAEDDISKALALDPDSLDALQLQMELYADAGYQKKALAIAERLGALEPDVRSWAQDAAEVRWENGQSDAAIEMMKALLDRPSGPTSLAMMYASAGRYRDAAGVLETAMKGPGKLPEVWLPQFRIAAALLRRAPSTTAFPHDFPPLDRVGFVYLYVGAAEHAVDSYQQYIKSGLLGVGDLFSYLWQASYAPARKTESFKQLVRDAGFVDYWRQRGWPDLCHPVGADDFACD